MCLRPEALATQILFIGDTFCCMKHSVAAEMSSLLFVLRRFRVDPVTHAAVYEL